MAISSSVLMKNGVTATYWKITQVNIDVQLLTACYIISPFLSSDTAANRLKPIGPSKVYKFPIEEDAIFTGTLTPVYTAILSLAGSSVPNLFESGTHIYDTDLASGTIVD